MVLTLAAMPAARAADKSSLDETLLQRAPEIVKYLRDHNWQNVGVLKFLVQKGTDPASDNAGPLNLSIARRLEVALVLANPDEKLGIIRDASGAVVDSKRRASHLTPTGRTGLFEVPYILAWGTDDAPVKADGFLTGLVQLSPDLATTTLTIQAFGKGQSEPAEVCKLTVPTDARTLTEAGQSYRLRQLSPAKGENAARAAHETAAGIAKHPLESSELQWEIYYDNEQVPITFRDGKASVKGPKQGQIVWFALRNNGKVRQGVVLRVNGENTLYREKLPSSLCRKWILDPGDRVVVRGFQSDDKSAAEFMVLSPEESEKEEVNYGEHAGTFSLEVFAARAEDNPIPAEDPKVKAVENGELPSGKPIKLATLQQKLVEPFRGPAKISGGRRQISGQKDTGIVVGGNAIESPVERVTFEPAPVPIVSATVRYYTPAR
jgi:hypothetical protein